MGQKEIEEMIKINKTTKPEFQIREENGEFITKCHNCKAELQFKAPTRDFVCPKCGAKNVGLKGLRDQLAGIVIGLILLIIFLWILF